MVALSQKTAIALANQAFDELGMRYPWSFVAVPSPERETLKLRLIQVAEDLDMSVTVSHARPVHAFLNECKRSIASLSRVMRETIQRKQHLRDEEVAAGGAA